MRVQNELFAVSKYQNADAHLVSTRREYLDLGPDEIDFEMQFGKRTDDLMLRRLTQKGLEHFVRNYGDSYRVLYLDDCTRIQDFAPLGELADLEAIRIDWTRKASTLWDMSGNHSLKVLSIGDSKKLSEKPHLLNTSKTLEEVRFWGPTSGGTYTMESVECFRNMLSLRRIDLNWIKLADKSMDALETLPNLEEFHFEPGMLTTEEIARIVARYPNLCGDSLRAFDDTYLDEGEVRICGFRKPTLHLPQQQKRLEEYIEQFNALVEAYRREKT